MLEQDRSEEARPKVLDEVTLDGIVKHIQKLAASNDGEPQKISLSYIYNNVMIANRIIVMTGAGISTG